MRQRMLKKAVLCILVFSLLASMFTACGSSTSTNSGSGSTAASDSSKISPEASAPSIPLYTQRPDTKGKSPEEILKGDIIYAVDNIKFPISAKPITLTILRPFASDDAEYNQMPVLADYEKKTNIHIEWVAPPSADFKDKYNLLISSGQIPDAIMDIPEAGDIEKYGQQGLFIELNELISKNMPNLKKVLDENVEAKRTVSNDEGKIYSLPIISAVVPGNNVMMVRQDWLDKLGLQFPETTDDWYNVLKAFKNMDPKNITPFSGYGNDATYNGARSMIAAWGVSPEGLYAAEGMVQPKDGKVHYGPIEPLFKEGVEWLQKLYKEGLIDPEILTNDDKAFQAKVMQDKVGAWRGWVNGDMYKLNKTAEANGKKDLKVREAPIMKGPHGDQIHFWKDASTRSAMVITKNNKYPVETAIWADYWYSEWGRTYVYGIENLTWTLNDRKEPVWTDYVLKNPEGKDTNKVRGAITFGRNTWPCIFQPWSLTASTVDPYVEESRLKYRVPEKMVVPIPPDLSFKQEQNEKIASVMTDIKTYSDEVITQFIINKKPISEWDAYVKKVNEMGIQEILDMYTASYQKWKER